MKNMKNSYEKIPMRTCLNENFGSIGEELIPEQFLMELYAIPTQVLEKNT